MENKRSISASIIGSNSIAGRINRPQPVSSTIERGHAVRDHADLENRDLDNQHPINAITGLSDILDTKLEQEDLDIESARAKKAENALLTGIENEKVRAIEAEDSLDENKVDKEDGKGLSTNDFETAYLEKLKAIESGAQVNSVLSVAGKTGEVQLDKNDVGLSAVDNTSDADKPISVAQQKVFDNIIEKIPVEASKNNKLADKDFVNSSIATATANFINTFESVEDLLAYSGPITKNDYAYVIIRDEVSGLIKQYDKYKYNEIWKFEYTLNNSSFTATQWAAINSGITADFISTLKNALEDHATKASVELLDKKLTDLDSSYINYVKQTNLSLESINLTLAGVNSWIIDAETTYAKVADVNSQLNALDSRKVEKELKTNSDTDYKVLSDNNFSDDDVNTLSDVNNKKHTHDNKSVLDATTDSFTVALHSDITANKADRHSHVNKALLDTYTQTDLDLKNAVIQKHSHANKELLDTYNQTNTDIKNAIDLAHGHTNKELLDSYTQSDEAISDAVLKKHAHTNGDILDNTTASFTTEEKEKLANIEENANNYILPDDVVQDAKYIHTDNNYTTIEKNKLKDVERNVLELDAAIKDNFISFESIYIENVIPDVNIADTNANMGFFRSIDGKSINIDNTIKSVEYEKLTIRDKENNLVKNLLQYPTTLRSAGTIHDKLYIEIESNEKFTLKKDVNVGSYTFNGNESYVAVNTKSYYITNFGLAGYTIETNNILTNASGDFTSLYINNLSAFVVNYNTDTTIESFKNTFVGKTIVYELATPKTEIIATNLTKDDISAILQAYGTVEVINANSECVKVGSTWGIEVLKAPSLFKKNKFTAENQFVKGIEVNEAIKFINNDGTKSSYLNQNSATVTAEIEYTLPVKSGILAIQEDVDKKLNSSDQKSSIYGVDTQGNQVNIKFDSEATDAYSIVQRNANGEVITAQPSTDNSATNKKYVENLLSAKVDKIDGKGLSTNDLTDDLKKSIEDSAASAHTHTNKLTLDAITAAFTTEQQNKLANIEAKAQVNKLEQVKVNGNPLTIDATDKSVNIETPTKVSDLVNDSKFISGTAQTFLCLEDLLARTAIMLCNTAKKTSPDLTNDAIRLLFSLTGINFVDENNIITDKSFIDIFGNRPIPFEALKTDNYSEVIASILPDETVDTKQEEFFKLFNSSKRIMLGSGVYNIFDLDPYEISPESEIYNMFVTYGVSLKLSYHDYISGTHVLWNDLTNSARSVVPLIVAGTINTNNNYFIVFSTAYTKEELADIAYSGSYTDLANIPTKLSQFTDDLGTNPTHSHSAYMPKSGGTFTDKINTQNVNPAGSGYSIGTADKQYDSIYAKKIYQNGSDISTLYIGETKATEIANDAVANEESRATGIENALDLRIKAVEDDYLVAADKTALQNKIDAEATARANADATKMPYSGGTFTGKVTFNSAIDFKDINKAKVVTNSNTIINPASDGISAMPWAKTIWHDHFAFLANHKILVQEKTTDNNTWSTTDYNLTNLFIQKESNSVKTTILKAEDAAFRFVMSNSSFAYSRVDWFELDVSYNSPFSAFDILIEYSTDNVVWTEIHRSNVTTSAVAYYLRNTFSFTADGYLRFTFIKTSNLTTGLVSVSCLKAYTTRKADQGLGSEFEYPYNWNANRDMLPWTTNTQNIGSKSLQWDKVYAKNFYENGTDIASKYATKTELASLAAADVDWSKVKLDTDVYSYHKIGNINGRPKNKALVARTGDSVKTLFNNIFKLDEEQPTMELPYIKSFKFILPKDEYEVGEVLSDIHYEIDTFDGSYEFGSYTGTSREDETTGVSWTGFKIIPSGGREWFMLRDKTGVLEDYVSLGTPLSFTLEELRQFSGTGSYSTTNKACTNLGNLSNPEISIGNGTVPITFEGIPSSVYYPYVKITSSTTAATENLVKAEMLNKLGIEIAYQAGDYIYVYSKNQLEQGNIQVSVMGEWSNLNSGTTLVSDNTQITLSTGVKANYYVYRSTKPMVKDGVSTIRII